MNEIQVNGIVNLAIFAWIMVGLSTASFAVCRRWHEQPGWFQGAMWGMTVMIWPLYWAGIFLERRFAREPLQMRVGRPAAPPEEPPSLAPSKEQMAVCGFCPTCAAYTTPDDGGFCAICGAQLPF